MSKLNLRIWDNKSKKYLTQEEIGQLTVNQIKEEFLKSDRYVVESSTGKCDPTGKEVFENDVLDLGFYKCFDPKKNGQKVRLIVKWEDQQSRFILENPNVREGGSFLSGKISQKVIGTIHEEGLIDSVIYDKTC